MFSNILAYEKLNKLDSYAITTFATTFGAIFLFIFLIDINFSKQF